MRSLLAVSDCVALLGGATKKAKDNYRNSNSLRTSKQLGPLILPLALIALLTGCGLGDVADSYQTTVLNPVQTATFTQYDEETCPRFFGGLHTAVIPPALFEGMDEAGVGDNGLFDAGTEHHLFKMQTAFKFDFSSSGIPQESANPTLIANLIFTAQKTPRSPDDSSCQPVERVEFSTTPWRSTSDFAIPLSTEPFTTVPCTQDGTHFTCLVSVAVIRWLAQPLDFPNLGFVVLGPALIRNACNTNIGEPGDYYECVAELTSISLEIQYLPPGS